MNTLQQTDYAEILGFPPSPQQIDIFDKGLNTGSNICVSAAPGSGKTTTIVALSKLMRSRPSQKGLFLAFSRSIVEELKTKLPRTIECSTLHSKGYKSLIRGYRGLKFKMSEYKGIMFAKIATQGLKFKTDAEKFNYEMSLQDGLNLARMNYSTDFKLMCRKYALEAQPKDLSVAYNAMTDYNDNICAEDGKNVIDFTDMVFLPIYKNFRLDTYHEIFVDECQDLNACQLAFVEKMVKRYVGRIIAVGDKKQAIYSFAGADIKSFEKLEQRNNTEVLPLSVSYRCAKEIVKLAQKVYPDIQYHEDSPDGILRTDTSVSDAGQGDFILCRNVKPLITVYFILIGQNKKCTIVGKDIEKGLLNLTEKLNNYSKWDGFEKLEEMLQYKAEILSERGVKDPTNHPVYCNFEEEIEVLRIIAETIRAKSFREISAKIRDIFQQKGEAIKLMTIHKSKGLEANRVFVIEVFDGKKLIPSHYAKQDWELIQERNLMFVAYTRAKQELVLVNLSNL